MTQPSTEFLDLQTALAGEYSLQRELGRGGMGVVYLARDVQLDRDVAVKVLPTRLATRETRERFVREARTAAGLSHPHIVPIHRVGEAGGFVFFVMSYVEGETLGERLRSRGPLSPTDATRVMREVAWALAYAHGRGIVHRDIKPDNILLERGTGRALVTDFGIAHVSADMIATPSGGVMGTVHFMSPEQIASEPLDGRSDIYALGVVGYLAVTGRLPFEAPTLPALVVRQMSESAPPVSKLAPGLPSGLAQVIDRCLERDVTRRFGDGEALASALATKPDPQPALPPSLRAWLAARNPLLLPYLGWSGAFSVGTLGNLYANLTNNPGSSPGDVVAMAAIASAPILPIVGFHLNQARRQFRAGHTLADLRTALRLADRERTETEHLVRGDGEARTHRALRIATLISASWLATTISLVIAGVLHENRTNLAWIFGPILSTMVLGATSNALDVQFLPARVRKWLQTGIRERLWNGRLGEWFARRLDAPDRSQSVDGNVFRATEAALGVASLELFKALPQVYREKFDELPRVITALEAQAAAARADAEVVAALAQSGSADAEMLSVRREAAGVHLARSVAALEGIRLTLLRLHGGASDLAPLTTLMDAANYLGDDVNRLADAQQEVDRALMTGNADVSD